MNYYFIVGHDIGYNDLGICGSKYTAMSECIRLAKLWNNGKTYYLYNQNNMKLASIKSCPNATYKWITKNDF